MLTQLRIKNFRCLRDVCVPLGPLNFLVGRNNTGKSSLLHAIELLGRCVTVADVAKALVEDGRRGVKSESAGERLRRLLTGGQRDAELEVNCEVFPSREAPGWHSAQYVLALALERPLRPDGQNVVVTREHVRLKDSSGDVRRSFAVGKQPHPKRRVDLPSGATVNLEQWKRSRCLLQFLVQEREEAAAALVDELRSTPTYNLVPDQIAQPSPALPPQLRRDGFGLASCLDSFADRAPGRFEAVKAALRQFVPAIRHVTFPTVANGQKTILFHEQGGATIHASEASDGLLLFLAYLGIAYAHEDVGIVLAEEPETGVHPDRLRAIVQLLRAMSKGELGLPPVQVLVTSHSPRLLDWCSKEEVIYFDRDDGGEVRTKPLSDVPDMEERIEDFESLGEWIYAVGGEVCKSHS